MREECQGNNDSHSLEVSLGSEHRLVRARPGGLLLESERFFNLLILESDEWVVPVTATVVLCENVNSLRIPTMVDEPSWRLGEEEDERCLNHWGDTLKGRGDSPSPSRLNAESTKGRPSSDDRSEVPSRVVHRGEGTSVGREGKFGDENRSGDAGPSVSETDQESTSDEHADVLRSGLNSSTDDCDCCQKSRP